MDNHHSLNNIYHFVTLQRGVTVLKYHMLNVKTSACVYEERQNVNDVKNYK